MLVIKSPSLSAIYVVIITIWEAWGVVNIRVFVFCIIIRMLEICERHPLATSGFQHGFGHCLMGAFAEFGDDRAGVRLTRGGEVLRGWLAIVA